MAGYKKSDIDPRGWEVHRTMEFTRKQVPGLWTPSVAANGCLYWSLGRVGTWVDPRRGALPEGWAESKPGADRISVFKGPGGVETRSDPRDVSLGPGAPGKMVRIKSAPPSGSAQQHLAGGANSLPAPPPGGGSSSKRHSLLPSRSVGDLNSAREADVLPAGVPYLGFTLADCDAVRGAETENAVARNKEWREHYKMLQNLFTGTHCKVFSVRAKAGPEPRVMVIKLVTLPQAEDLKKRRKALAEAKISAALSAHPNIVKLHEGFVSRKGNTLSMVMEFCQCASLQHFVDNHRNDLAAMGREMVTETFLAEERVLNWFVGAACALAFMHSAGILHLDICLSNLLLSGAHVVKVADFGSAVKLDGPPSASTSGVAGAAGAAGLSATLGAPPPSQPALKRGGSALSSTMPAALHHPSAASHHHNLTASALADLPGSITNCAPEVIEGGASAASAKADAWALGVVLYELCALRHPFDKSTSKTGSTGSRAPAPEIARCILTQDPPGLPVIYSADLRNVAHLLLRKDPSRRPSITEILTLPFLQPYILSRNASFGLGEAAHIPTAPLTPHPPSNNTNSTLTASPPTSPRTVSPSPPSLQGEAVVPRGGRRRPVTPRTVSTGPIRGNSSANQPSTPHPTPPPSKTALVA